MHHVWYSHGTWWINRSAVSKPTSGCFSSVGSPDRPPDPGVRPHPTSSAGTFTHLSATLLYIRIWLERLSRGNGRQGASEHLARRPSSMGSANCHRRRLLPIALRQSFAPTFSRLHEPNPQRGMRTYKMVVRSPPFYMSQQLWSLLGSGPGASCSVSRHHHLQFPSHRDQAIIQYSAGAVQEPGKQMEEAWRAGGGAQDTQERGAEGKTELMLASCRTATSSTRLIAWCGNEQSRSFSFPFTPTGSPGADPDTSAPGDGRRSVPPGASASHTPRKARACRRAL
jgi:hypothetical protein